MKKLLFTSGLIALSMGFTFAQGKKLNKTTSPNQVTTGQLEQKVDNTKWLKWNEETHDFGTLKQGAPATFEFEFTNVGKEPVSIQSAKSTCGCTVPTYSTDPIMPGKKGKIKVTYDSNRIGGINKPITVTTTFGTQVLHIKGNIEKGPEGSVPANNTSVIKNK